ISGNEVLDVALGGELELLLDLDLDPEALAVEAILVAEPLAEHGVIALVGVLVGTPPGMVNTHGVVGSDGAVEEGPARAILVLVEKQLEGSCFVPELEDGALLTREIDLRLDLFERHDTPLDCINDQEVF